MTFLLSGSQSRFVSSVSGIRDRKTVYYWQQKKLYLRMLQRVRHVILLPVITVIIVTFDSVHCDAIMFHLILVHH